MRTSSSTWRPGSAYTVLGIYNQNYIYSVFEGAAFLCLFVVGIPALWRRVASHELGRP